MDSLPTDLPLPNTFPAVMDPSLAVPPRFLNETRKTVCPFPDCLNVFGRVQENARHIYTTHLPDHLSCGQAGCDWTGDRVNMLRNHLKVKHPGAELPGTRQLPIIYDARGLARQLLDKEITVERADFLAQSLFKTWALPRTLMMSVG